MWVRVPRARPVINEMNKPEEKDGIVWDASEECMARMGKDKKPDFTVTNVRLKMAWHNTDSNIQGFILGWETVSAGFGELTVYIDKTGKLYCDSEGMGKEFIKNVFSKLTELLPDG
jgi:hypothetical protein